MTKIGAAEVLYNTIIRPAGESPLGKRDATPRAAVTHPVYREPAEVVTNPANGILHWHVRRIQTVENGALLARSSTPRPADRARALVTRRHGAVYRRDAPHHQGESACIATPKPE